MTTIPSQCAACTKFKAERKDKVYCKHYPEGIPLEVECWDILCKHRKIPKCLLDDTLMYAMLEKSRQKRKEAPDEDDRLH